MKSKKPIHKKWWFWVIVIIVVVWAASQTDEQEASTDKVSEEKQETKRVEEQTKNEQTNKPEEQKEQKEQKEQNEKTAEPKKMIEKELKKKFGDSFLSLNGVFEIKPYSAQIELKGSENLTKNMTVEGMYMNVRDAVYIVKESGFEFENLGVSVKYPLIDQYGNESDEYVIKSDFSGETIKKLADDKHKIDLKNIPNIADSWWEHPALSR